MHTEGFPKRDIYYKRLFTIEETAHYLGLSVWSIRKRAYALEILFVSIGRRVLFDVKDLDELIENSKMRM